MGALEVVSPRAIGRRQRAAALEKRMLKFSGVYNAAALLRDSWHGAEERRQACAQTLADVVLQALQQPEADVEALLYALADSLCCSPLGTPWEA
jgi:hypothetical protein